MLLGFQKTRVSNIHHTSRCLLNCVHNFEETEQENKHGNYSYIICLLNGVMF